MNMGSSQVKVYNEQIVLNGPSDSKWYSFDFIRALFENDTETRICECVKIKIQGAIFYLFPYSCFEVNGECRMILNNNLRKLGSDSNNCIVEDNPIPQIYLIVERGILTANVNFQKHSDVQYSLWEIWIPTKKTEFKTEPFKLVNKYLV